MTRWRLSWERGPMSLTCIDSATLQRRVHLRLGRDPFAAGEGAAQIHTLRGRIRRLSTPADRWQITFEILDEDRTAQGRRQLTARGSGCRRLDQAIALIAAIAVDTGTLAVAAPEAPAGTSRPVLRAPPVPAERAAAAAEPVPRPRISRAPRASKPARGPVLSPSLRAGGVLDVGTLPGAALGAALQLDADFPRAVPLTFSASFWPHGEVDAAGGSARFRLITLALGVRPTVGLTRRLRLVLAGQLELGWLHGQGHGFDTDLGSTHTLFNLGADVGLQLRLSKRLHLGAGVGICGLLLREAFYVDELGRGSVRVHQPSPVSFRGGVSLGVTLR